MQVAITRPLSVGSTHAEHQLGQKRRALVLHKLLEGNRRTAEQAGDCVRDGRRRAAGKVAEQFGYRKLLRRAVKSPAPNRRL